MSWFQQTLAHRRPALVAGLPTTLRRAARTDLAVAILAAATTAALVVPLLELWRAALGVPFAYSGDATYNLMLIKGVIEHGSWYVNHDLGAPFGQHLYDFAVGGDDLDLLGLRLLGFLSRSPAVVMNLFYLVSFPLAAITAYAVLRWARLGKPVAFACSILFALSPYHFLRGESHLLLAADFGVPLGGYLVLGAWSGESMFSRRQGRSGISAYVSNRTLATVLACLVVASAGQVYYAGFTLVLVLLAVAGRLVARSAWRSILSGLAIAALVVAATAANLAPSFVYDIEHGRNHVTAARLAQESDVGGLKLAELLLPVPGHRVHALSRLTQWYDSSVTPQERGRLEQPALGAVASIGFVWLVLALAAGALGARARMPEIVARSRPAALAAASSFLVATVGGLSALIAYLLTPELRAWNRISIFIAFFSLLGIGILLERLGQALSSSWPRRIAFGGTLALIVGLGVLDQTSALDVPSYRALRAEYRRDARFVGAIEARIPHGSMIFQLPYLPFPEGLATGATSDYDLAKPYVHSAGLRWSYGAMRGRPEDWAQYVGEKPLQELVPAVAAAGFAGIYLDNAAYSRRTARALDHAIGQLVGRRPLVSAGGRYVFFELRRYAARLRARYGEEELAALREATLTPPRAVPGTGFSKGEERGTGGQRSLWVVARRSTLDLYQPGRSQWATFFATVLHGRASSGTRRTAPVEVVLAWPGGAETRLFATPAGRAVQRRVFLRHGSNLLRIWTDARTIFAPWDPRTLYLDVLDARFGETAFTPFARTQRRIGRA